MASRLCAAVHWLASARWSLATGLVLVGLGCVLYFFLPPEPRWRLDDVGNIDVSFAGQGLFFTWKDSPPDERRAVFLRDLRTGEPVHRFFEDGEPLPRGSFDLRFVPQSNLVVWVDHKGRALRLASVADGTERSIRFPGGQHALECRVSPDGSFAALLLLPTENGAVRYRLALIELENGERLSDLPTASDVHFTPDCRWLFVAWDRDKRHFVKGWDMRQRKWVIEFTGRGTESPLDGCISSDGGTMIEHFRDEDGSRIGWAIWNLRTGAQLAVSSAKNRVYEPSYSTDGRRLMFRNSEEQMRHLQVLDTETGKILLKVPCERPFDEVVLSPDGRWLAAQFWNGGDDPVKVWSIYDVDRGMLLWKKQDPPHRDWVQPTPAFGPDGRTIVSYHGEQRQQPLQAEIRDTETGHLLVAVPVTETAGWYEVTVTVASDRRTHTIATRQFRQPPPWWYEWALKAMHLIDEDDLSEGRSEIAVLDVEAREVRRHNRPSNEERVEVLNHGQVLLTIADDAPTGDKPGHVTCWDLPAHGPWRWVIGIPACLGALIALVAAIRQRRAMLKKLALQVPELVATPPASEA